MQNCDENCELISYIQIIDIFLYTNKKIQIKFNYNVCHIRFCTINNTGARG